VALICDNSDLVHEVRMLRHTGTDDIGDVIHTETLGATLHDGSLRGLSLIQQGRIIWHARKHTFAPQADLRTPRPRPSRRERNARHGQVNIRPNYQNEDGDRDRLAPGEGSGLVTEDASRAAWLQEARSHLRYADPVLARLVDERPAFDPRAWMAQLPPMDLYGALLFQVTGQQLSVPATRRTLAESRRFSTAISPHRPRCWP
jgi:hypothetical protein